MENAQLVLEAVGGTGGRQAHAGRQPQREFSMCQMLPFMKREGISRALQVAETVVGNASEASKAAAGALVTENNARVQLALAKSVHAWLCIAQEVVHVRMQGLTM